jgi:hypothetical protein
MYVINLCVFEASGYGTAMFSTLNSQSRNVPQMQMPQFMSSMNGFNQHFSQVSQVSDLEDAKQIRHLKMQALKVCI